jgi:hypothetical protein
VNLHVRLEMIFRSNFFVTNRATVNRYFYSMKSAVPCEKLLVDEALATVFIGTLERLVTGMSCY